MGSGRTLGLLGMAAVLVCLAGSLHASAADAGFTVRTRVAHAPARIDWSVPYSGEWDVTVGFDAARCEITCTYRLKRDEFGRSRVNGFLLPPAAAIRLYQDSGAAAETLVVDPGGLEQPGMASRAVPVEDLVYLPGRGLAGSAPASACGSAPAATRPGTSVSQALPTAIAVSDNLPLRI